MATKQDSVLDVSSQGRTVDEAKAHLREAVEAFLEETTVALPLNFQLSFRA